MTLQRQLRSESDFEQLPEDVPVSAHVADTEERGGFSVYYVFVIEVKNKGGSKYFIYRRYSQFLTLHTKLEENYGPENGIAPYLCPLPTLPGKIYVGNKKDIAESRIPSLNVYMKLLLSSPVWLLLDEDLRIFFYQTEYDSERVPRALRRLRPQTRRVKNLCENTPEMDRPRAEALFDFNATKPTELSLKKGELVYLLGRVNRDWMEGTFCDRTGIFPQSFVRIIKDLEHNMTSFLRCFFHDHDMCQIREIALEEDLRKLPSYNELLDVIRNQFPGVEVALNMQDTEGELIRLQDDSDMLLLITQGKKKPHAKNFFPWELHVTREDDLDVYSNGA